MSNRTCVGCRRVDDQRALIRLVLREGKIEVGRSLSGRGAYVHQKMECVTRAVEKNEFPRAFRKTFAVPQIEDLWKAVAKEEQRT